MLVCYLDDSGTDRDVPVLTMAGYASPSSDWEKFEVDSNALFKREKLKAFHAKEFADRDPPFHEWNWIKQTRFVDDWMRIAEQHVKRGITISMPKRIYKDRKKEFGLDPSRSVYGHAFGEVINAILADSALHTPAIEQGLSIVVESGNKNNAEILQFFQKLQKKAPFDQFLKDMSFCKKRDCKAIQLADFLAYFSRRHAWGFVEPERRKMMVAYLHTAKERVKTIGQLAEDFTPASSKRTP